MEREERRESSRWQYDASDKVVRSRQGWQYGASDLDLAATQAEGVWVSGVWVSGTPTIAAYSRRRLTGLVWSGGLGSTQLYLVVSGLDWRYSSKVLAPGSCGGSTVPATDRAVAVRCQRHV